MRFRDNSNRVRSFHKAHFFTNIMTCFQNMFHIQHNISVLISLLITIVQKLFKFNCMMIMMTKFHQDIGPYSSVTFKIPSTIYLQYTSMTPNEIFKFFLSSLIGNCVMAEYILLSDGATSFRQASLLLFQHASFSFQMVF